MRVSYCRQKDNLTIKLERQEFEDLKYQAERDDNDIIWSIIDRCDGAIYPANNSFDTEEFEDPFVNQSGLRSSPADT